MSNAKSAPPITLSSPRYRVILGDPEQPDTWRALEVQAITRDMQGAEELFARHKWGKPQDQPIRMVAVSAYLALRRSGQIEGSWDDFDAAYLDVDQVSVDAIPPTGAGLDPA
jgi:hypothetical protein